MFNLSGVLVDAGERTLMGSAWLAVRSSSKGDGLSHDEHLERGARDAGTNAEGAGLQKSRALKAGEDRTLDGVVPVCRYCLLQKSTGGVGLREARVSPLHPIWGASADGGLAYG